MQVLTRQQTKLAGAAFGHDHRPTRAEECLPGQGNVCCGAIQFNHHAPGE